MRITNNEVAFSEENKQKGKKISFECYMIVTLTCDDETSKLRRDLSRHTSETKTKLFKTETETNTAFLPRDQDRGLKTTSLAVAIGDLPATLLLSKVCSFLR